MCVRERERAYYFKWQVQVIVCQMLNGLCIYDSLICLTYTFTILMIYDIDTFC